MPLQIAPFPWGPRGRALSPVPAGGHKGPHLPSLQTAAWFSRALGRWTAAQGGEGRVLLGLLCWAGPPPGRRCSPQKRLCSPRLVSRCTRSTDALPENRRDFHEQPGVGVMRGCEHFPHEGSGVNSPDRAVCGGGAGQAGSSLARPGTPSLGTHARRDAVPAGPRPRAHRASREGSTGAGGVPSPRENRGLGTREIWGLLRRGAAFNSPKAWEGKAASGRG